MFEKLNRVVLTRELLIHSLEFLPNYETKTTHQTSLDLVNSYLNNNRNRSLRGLKKIAVTGLASLTLSFIADKLDMPAMYYVGFLGACSSAFFGGMYHRQLVRPRKREDFLHEIAPHVVRHYYFTFGNKE